MNHAWKRLRAEGVDVWLDVSVTVEGAAREVRRALAQGEVAGVRMAGPQARSAAGTARTAPTEPAGPTESTGLTDEIRRVCDTLLPRYWASGGAKGLVSVPLPAPPAPEAVTWVARARALREGIDRPNLVVRLPAEAADTATLRALCVLDIAVEVSGVRSPRQYGRAATALLAALDESTRSASFISFDVTGIEGDVDARLDLIGSDEAKALRGRAGLACARLAHRTHEMTFASARWGALAAAGTPEPKPLWVTGTASPSRAAHAVQELVTRGTAAAMTPAAAHVLAESGTVSGDRVWRHYADAERTLAYLDWFGVPVESLAARPPQVPAAAKTLLPPARTHRTAPAGTTAYHPGTRRSLAPA
ncbi:transaldolase family protein [Streptomyces sp. NPDC029674]|uniref:transaldolase family protein n=1 Tax=Streptomyces sp. NPDC029674 TaxID=3365297 RepID=UPI00384F1722